MCLTGEFTLPQRCVLRTLSGCLLRTEVCCGDFVTHCLDGGAFSCSFLFIQHPPRRELLIYDCNSASLRQEEKKKGMSLRIVLHGGGGGGAYVFRFHVWVECKFIIHCQWKMSSATQKKAKILGHVALVLENNMPLTGRLRLISCDQE